MSTNSEEIAREIPGYYWGTEQAPPEDADTADSVTVDVTYGVEVQEADGEWRWSGVALPDLEWAESHATNYTGTSAPVPVHRRVVEVTRTSYVWGADYADVFTWTRVAVAEAHVVISEHTYTGLPDPWDEAERRYPPLRAARLADEARRATSQRVPLWRRLLGQS